MLVYRIYQRVKLDDPLCIYSQPAMDGRDQESGTRNQELGISRLIMASRANEAWSGREATTVA